jgi:hypothetical protein
MCKTLDKTCEGCNHIKELICTSQRQDPLSHDAVIVLVAGWQKECAMIESQNELQRWCVTFGIQAP